MIILILLLIFILIYLVVGLSFFEYAIKSNTKRDRKDNHNSINEENAQFLKEKSKNVYMKSFDNKFMHAYLINKENSNKYVIIVHGYTSEGVAMVKYAKEFYDRNFNCLLVDQRCKGESAGRYVGMGLLESKDIKKWVNYIIENVSKDAEIVLFGVSMGAATVMLTTGLNLPSNVKAVIEDCGYTRALEEFEYKIKHSFHIAPSILLIPGKKFIKFFAKYDLEDVNPILSMKKCDLPVLFIHGDKDDYVPPYMGKKLFEECKSDKKECYFVKDAEHARSYKTAPKEYFEKIEQFLNKNM